MARAGALKPGLEASSKERYWISEFQIPQSCGGTGEQRYSPCRCASGWRSNMPNIRCDGLGRGLKLSLIRSRQAPAEEIPRAKVCRAACLDTSASATLARFGRCQSSPIGEVMLSIRPGGYRTEHIFLPQGRISPTSSFVQIESRPNFACLPPFTESHSARWETPPDSAIAPYSAWPARHRASSATASERTVSATQRSWVRRR